ncbi:unnamed protein product [Lota lota]
MLEIRSEGEMVLRAAQPDLSSAGFNMDPSSPRRAIASRSTQKQLETQPPRNSGTNDTKQSQALSVASLTAATKHRTVPYPNLSQHSATCTPTPTHLPPHIKNPFQKRGTEGQGTVVFGTGVAREAVLALVYQSDWPVWKMIQDIAQSDSILPPRD